METEPLLSFEPSELCFPFELNKKLSSSTRLFNKTDDYVAFKFLSTNPRNYVVRPRIGILLPRSTCDIAVTMRALREAPPNMRCKDKFMIRCSVATPDATIEDARRMIDREAGHGFHEWKLNVVYGMPMESSLGTSVIENSDSHVHEATQSVLEPHDDDLQISTRKMLDVQPSELQFPSVSLNKELSSSIQLSNVTNHHVAFRVKTASPKYFVQPNYGILLPQSKCDITVRKQAESKIPCDVQNEDKLLIQSVVVPDATATENTTLDLEFDKENSSAEECEVQVAYIFDQENNSNHVGELILRGIVSALLVLFSIHLMKPTLSWIWSLAMIGIMLAMKMIKKLVSDSVEDWIVKTLLYICMHILFGRKNNNISLS